MKKTTKKVSKSIYRGYEVELDTGDEKLKGKGKTIDEALSKIKPKFFNGYGVFTILKNGVGQCTHIENASRLRFIFNDPVYRQILAQNLEVKL